MNQRLLLPAFACLVALAIACSSDDSISPSATAAPPNPTGAASTTAPQATAQSGTFAPVEGTVDPLGFGSTDPVTVKPNPDPPAAISVLKAIRTGAHPERGGWDRIVFEFEGSNLPAGDVRYVTSASNCGSGMPVQLSGGAILLVKFEPAQAHTDAGQPTLPSNTVAGPGNAIVQARSACDFEAHVDWAIGVKSQQRFKVTRLVNPTRLVVDIKWP